MKRAKLLSLFLAGSLLFQTAGIDVMATAPSKPAPISGTADGSGLSDPSSDETNNPDQPSDDEKDKDPAGEENQPQQPSGEENGKNPAGEEGSPSQPSDEETEDPSREEGDPDQSSDEENKDNPPAGEEETPDQPAEEKPEDSAPAEDEGKGQDSVSENTVSENTISENTLPEESEASIFSIFPGLGDSYQFSAQELADKRVLAAHVDDVVQIQSTAAATIEDYQDADDEYELGEVVYLAETKAEAEQVAEAFGGTVQSYSYEVAVINLPKKATVALAVAAASEPDIKLPAVWPNYYNYLDTDTNATVNPLVPSDPEYTKQWYHDYIGTRYAWAAGYKGQGVKVAVIDTGVTRNHEDLQANAVDGRTFVDGANGTPQNTDNDEHGTHVAGIIAADDNGKGGVGIAPDAQVRGYSVFAADGRCTTAWILSAINAAVEDGNDIINMSLGSPNYSKAYEDTVKDAYNAGVAIFASSGNDDSNGNNFPAAYASTISIGAVDENSSRASFSNYGSTVTMSFPGVNIYSTVPSGYKSMDGTSMASPAAAGTAAVILSARGDIRGKSGKARVDALLSAMKSSTTKCATSGMGAGTTYLPGVLKLATDMTTPETPVIEIVNEAGYERGKNKKDYIAEGIGVKLSTKTAVGVDIYYSTDGKTPTFKNGAITNAENPTPYRINDIIMLTGAKSKTIKAIAVNPISGKVSKVASKTVTLTPIPKSVTVAPTGNVTNIVAGKSLKFTAMVELPYAISKNVAWTVVDADGRDAKAKGVTVTNGTVKTTSSKTLKTPAGTYTVKATAVGSTDLKKFDGTSGSYAFTVIESSAVKKVAFTDPATNKAPKAKSIKTTDSKTTDENKELDLSAYLTVTMAGATAKEDKVIKGGEALAEVVWSSSNTKIATVSDKGVITAVAPGKATIKATSNDGGNRSASYNVTVVQPVTGITISGPANVAAGKGIMLTATVTPANASNKKLEWTVNGDGKIVSIGKTNGRVSTKKNANGTYTVTARAADHLGAAATYTIAIEDQEITEIRLNTNKLTLFPDKTNASNKTAKLTATVKGKAAGSSAKPTEITTSLITWTSSAPSIASVDQSGNITAKAPGRATITCAAADGSNKKATCAVTVNVPMSKLVVGPTNGNSNFVAVGKKAKMAAKYYSNYGTPSSKKIKWMIDYNNNVTLMDKVSIDKNGTVSVSKDLTLPYGGTYWIGIQAVAEDGSGVTSNTYSLAITPSYAAIRLKKIATTDKNNNINGYFFVVQATDKKDKKGKPDWGENDKNAIMLPSYYCTATVSGPKNIGLSKDSLTDGAVIYGPQPLKWTSKQLDYLGIPNGPVLTTKECDKITLTVTLKDGSNLKAKNTSYAVEYKNYAGNWVIGYYQ